MMTTIEESVATFVEAATQFERRLSAVLGERKPAVLRVEATKRLFKVMLFHPWRHGLYARIDKESGVIRDFMHRCPGFDPGNTLAANYVFPAIPEPDTSEAALWEAWYQAFEQIPFGITGDLTELLKKNDVAALAEAIEIAGRKRDDLRSDRAQLHYVQGVLRQRHLWQLAPELAAKMKDFHALRVYWGHQRQGRGFLNRGVVMQWLECCTADEIRIIMRATDGWTDLKIRNGRDHSLAANDATREWRW